MMVACMNLHKWYCIKLNTDTFINHTETHTCIHMNVNKIGKIWITWLSWTVSVFWLWYFTVVWRYCHEKELGKEHLESLCYFLGLHMSTITSNINLKACCQDFWSEQLKLNWQYLLSHSLTNRMCCWFHFFPSLIDKNKCHFKKFAFIYL